MLVDLDGLADPGATPTLQWGNVDGAASYTREYSDNAGFDDPTSMSGLSVTDCLDCGGSMRINRTDLLA